MRRLLDALFAPWLVTILVLFVSGSLLAFVLEPSGWSRPEYLRLLFAMALCYGACVLGNWVRLRPMADIGGRCQAPETGKHGYAFDDSIPLDRLQGAKVEALVVGSISMTLKLTNDRRIHLDYQGCIEERDTWLCKLPLCGEPSLMNLVQQTIELEFPTPDRALVHFSGGGTIELVRDAPGADLVRFGIGEDEFQA